MTMQFKASVLQYCAAASAAETLPIIEELVAESAAQGASFVCLPECATFLSRDRQALFDQAEDETTSPSLARLSLLAKTYQIFLSVGSLLMRDAGADKCTNRGYLLNPLGKISARYNKIHMFDVTLSKNESYRESNLYQKGKKLVTVKTPWSTIGLTICYDLRFPTMYRKLAQAGAKIIFIPSAFTRTTGRAHWLTLVKARAIENGCFIVAPAQFGQHYKGRETFGHSVIISPWGKIIKIKKSGIGIITAELSLKEVEISRKSIPSLKIN